MGNLNVNVSDTDLDRLEEAMRDAVEDTAEDVLDWATDSAEEDAKDVIRLKGRIWNFEVYNGFVSHEQRVTTTTYKATLTNEAPHANIVDKGRKPGRAPQAQQIIEWVDDKVMTTLVADGGDDALDPETLDDESTKVEFHPVESSPIYTHGYKVTSVKTADGTAHIDTGANYDSIRMVEFEDGSRGVFKLHDEIDTSKGSTYNEKIFYDIAKEFGWPSDGGFLPADTWTIEDVDGKRIGGSLLHFKGDAMVAEDAIQNYFSPSSGINPVDFVEDNTEWLARVGVLDYVIGNSDRHHNNWLLDFNDQPWAIDNGGATLYDNSLDKSRMKKLLVDNIMYRLDMSDPNDPNGYFLTRYEDMHRATNDVLDRQSEIFDQLLRDPELRRELVEMAESLHPEDSVWKDHFQQFLHPDTEGSSYYHVYGEKVYGKELWRYDIEQARAALDEKLDERLDDTQNDDGEFDGPEFSTPEELRDSTLTSVDELLDELLGHMSS